jgi:hypothetical protein
VASPHTATGGRESFIKRFRNILRCILRHYAAKKWIVINQFYEVI